MLCKALQIIAYWASFCALDATCFSQHSQVECDERPYFLCPFFGGYSTESDSQDPSFSKASTSPSHLPSPDLELRFSCLGHQSAGALHVCAPAACPFSNSLSEISCQPRALCFFQKRGDWLIQWKVHLQDLLSALCSCSTTSFGVRFIFKNHFYLCGGGAGAYGGRRGFPAPETGSSRWL